MQLPGRRHDGATVLERLRAGIEAAGDLVYSWDLATDRIEWIGATGAVFGPSQSDVPASGDHFNGRVNPEDLPVRLQALSESIAGTRAFDCEYRVRAASGEFRWLHDRGAVELSAAGTPMRMSGTMRTIDERRRRQAHLEHLANYDELTGHFNKARLREALDHALAHSLRYGRPGALLVVGLDQLDRVNAAYGHEVGDKVLVEVAHRLDRCLRSTDVIGRIGSDRFGALLHVSDETESGAIGERILLSLREQPIVALGNRVRITASIGMVHFPEQSSTSFDVIAKAEGALLKAKSSGRDCLHVYRLSQGERDEYRASMQLGEEVRRALSENRLVFAYQPIVDAHTLEVRCYECLLRMVAPDGKVIAAGRFVPVVERLGMMRDLDRRALDMALRDLEAHPRIMLTVNISGVTAADRGWLRALVSRLKDRRDLAARLIVEITETAALHDLDDTARFISILRDLGCQVAVDDFGAGYTTFRHLKSLTVDMVKIDGSFVSNLAENFENQLFIRNLLGLARNFNLITVGECVETEQEAAILRDEGVHLLQGYLFGRPELTPAWRTGAAPPAPSSEGAQDKIAIGGGQSHRA